LWAFESIFRNACITPLPFCTQHLLSFSLDIRQSWNKIHMKYIYMYMYIYACVCRGVHRILLRGGGEICKYLYKLCIIMLCFQYSFTAYRLVFPFLWTIFLSIWYLRGGAVPPPPPERPGVGGTTPLLSLPCVCVFSRKKVNYVIMETQLITVTRFVY
jgi:hypothetical protein